MLRRTALLLLVGRASSEACVDSNKMCSAWASSGECQANPGYMQLECRKSCDPACGGVGGGAAPKRESWETENLEVALPDSAVIDVDEANLPALLARETRPVVVWFYAPWCKQCKIARPGFEAAARSDVASGAVFARLDCVANPAAKKMYGVNSYPAFKVLRGSRHRWMEMGRQRTAEVIEAAVARELRGPFDWVHSSAALSAALHNQVADPSAPEVDRIGQGEALAVAVLPAANDDPSALASHAGQLYANATSGCSARLSPLPFVATTDESLLPALGLPRVPVGHVALVQLYTEPDAAPAIEQQVPRLVSRPLQLSARAGAAGAAGDDTGDEQALCRWLLGYRLPLLLDFDASPMWGKRAGNLHFVTLHALLFLSPPHAALASDVRRAAARFERGTLLVMTFMVEGMDVGGNAMLPRYGVNSVLDTPRLVFLDQRIVDGENRQLPYTARHITEEGVVDFLRGAGLAERDAHDDASAAKDEL